MNTSALALYYLPVRQRDRWFWGDRYFRNVVRRVLRGKPQPGGVDMVFINLCKGLDLLGIQYRVNIPFKKLNASEIVCILGKGSECLNDFHQTNPIVAGIGLMTHPAQWPDLCQQYPIKRYLQHCKWSNDLYTPFYGEKICQDLWPVGIDTGYWAPDQSEKDYDILIYNKIRWEKEKFKEALLNPIKTYLRTKKLSFKEIEYGKYQRTQYKQLLKNARAMIFITEHESQGLAYQEALSMNVPIIAWNPGRIMDPQYKAWGDYGKPASSVPYWNEYCGEVFTSIEEFNQQLDLFLKKLDQGVYQPRNYIEQNLSLKGCAQMFLNIVEKVAAENNETRSQQL